MTPQAALTILIVFIVSIIVFMTYQTLYNPPISEGFESETKTELTFCPLKTKELHDKEGNTICCENSDYISTQTCCIRSAGATGYKSCRAMLEEDYTYISKQVCPDSMPNYYEDKEGNKQCTAEQLSDSLTEPAVHNSSKPSCKIYATDKENQETPTSCYNLKLLEEVDCQGIDCVKQIVVRPHSTVPLVQLQFSDQDGNPHSCYTNTSYANYKSAMNIKDTTASPELCDEMIARYNKQV